MVHKFAEEGRIVDVYVPLCVRFDLGTGRIEGIPYADYEGAPWMYVGSEDALYDDRRGWFSDEEVELKALAALFHLLEAGHRAGEIDGAAQ